MATKTLQLPQLPSSNLGKATDEATEWYKRFQENILFYSDAGIINDSLAYKILARLEEDADYQSL
jgi:hypothetical protein